MSDDQHEHNHFYVTPDVLPKPDATDTEWIQRVTMLAELSENLARSIFWYLRINAPILVEESAMLYGLLAGLGLTMKGIQLTGADQLAKRGLKPLDLDEDQRRAVRDQLADPNCPTDMREHLLSILACGLDERPTAPPPAEDFPEGGFVIGGDEQG